MATDQMIPLQAAPDDARQDVENRHAADSRARELLAAYPAVRIVRWENDQV